MPFLRELLPHDKYQVIDFDSRGVPDGADRNWRITEATHWVEEGVRANQAGKELIVCGFAKPQDFAGLQEPIEVNIIVLHADEQTIRNRLIGRYTKDGIFDEDQKVIGKPVREFIDGNIWYAKQMREESVADGLAVIDTSLLSPEEVARKVVDALN
jgi:hypothetical protein